MFDCSEESRVFKLSCKLNSNFTRCFKCLGRLLSHQFKQWRGFNELSSYLGQSFEVVWGSLNTEEETP